MGGQSDPLAAFGDDPGAQIFRACVACHTLNSAEANRAGPSLHGIFGRKIATLPGYNFSPALKNLDIVWTPETLSTLFEIGPAAYTPGTKMPEQRINFDPRSQRTDRIPEESDEQAMTGAYRGSLSPRFFSSRSRR